MSSQHLLESMLKSFSCKFTTCSVGYSTCDDIFANFSKTKTSITTVSSFQQHVLGKVSLSFRKKVS